MPPKATILYIEDDLHSRNLVRRVLTHAGYTVLTAERGLEGIDLARRHRPDLILTDINLPDLSGREITMRLRSDPQLMAVPIVALTAQVQNLERDKTFAAGVSGYLTKPIEIQSLTATIEEYLQGRRDTVDQESLQAAQRAYSLELVDRLEATVRDLEVRNRELQRLDRLKDDFIQLTAHELRTPLTTVYGYSHLVQSSPTIQHVMALDPDVNACLTGLLDSIERLHSVVDEIIVISRIASGRVDLRLNRVNLKALIQSVVQDYRNILAQRSQVLQINYDTWDFSFMADQELLDLAFSNLLGNAIKYTPDRGTITLGAEHLPAINRVRLSFADSGIGVDPADHQQIFDRFYTTGDTQLHSTSKTAFRGGGLGLGLAICRGIVEAHEGRIWVESEGCDPHRLPGSTFYVELPLKQSVTGSEV